VKGLYLGGSKKGGTETILTFNVETSGDLGTIRFWASSLSGDIQKLGTAAEAFLLKPCRRQDQDYHVPPQLQVPVLLLCTGVITAVVVYFCWAVGYF